MKKLLGLLSFAIGISLLLFFIFTSHASPVKKDRQQITPSQKVSQVIEISKKTLFVPYWTLDTIASDYDEYIYFGVSPNEKGIDTTEEGYKNISSFVLQTERKKTLLAIRMLNTSLTEKALQDNSLAEKIIQDSIRVARTNGFGGIVLDLEYSGLALPSVRDSLANFSTTFAKEVKSQNLSFYQALYGDTYYLGRPYNVGEIAQEADGIFVMSYDFHKANGTPGPNFPLTNRVDSDYTFQQMLRDFSKDVPKDKLTIVFGMFGYDWKVDEKGRSIGTAKSISTNEALVKFIGQCSFKNCNVNSSKTFEIQVTYTDGDGQAHEVWFDEQSTAEEREGILRQNGMSKIGFWANGYF